MTLDNHIKGQVCFVSGLPVTHMETMQNIRLSENYTVSFSKIGDFILHADAQGDMEEYDIDTYALSREKAIEFYFPKGDKFIEIKNYKNLINLPSLMSRRNQRNFIKQEIRNRLIASIFYNLSPLLKTSINLGIQLENSKERLPIYIADTYEDAINTAQKINQNTLNTGLADQEDEIYIKIKKKDIENLKHRLNIIALTGSQEKETSSYSSENKDIKEIYDVIEIIEKDYVSIIEQNEKKTKILEDEKSKFKECNDVLENTIENLNVGIALTELDSGKIVKVNYLMESYLNLDKDQIIGKTCENLFCINKKGNCIFRNNEYAPIENIEWKLGKCPVLKSSRSISLNNKKYALMSFIDISQRRAVEKKTKLFQNDLIMLTNSTTDLIFLNNQNSVLRYIGRGVNEFIPNSIIIVNKFKKEEHTFEIVDIIKDRRIHKELNEKDFIPGTFELKDEIFFEWLNESFKRIDHDIKSLPGIIKNIRLRIPEYQHIYICSLSYEKHLYGSVFILTNKTSINNKEIVNSFISQASMTIYKRELEADLRAGKLQAENSLKTKEVLLKEVHHRVKNNMSIISSLLKLQASNIKDPFLEKAYTDSRNRIKSMALVHEKLYAGSDLEHIDLNDYLKTLTKHLISSYKILFVGYEIKIENIFISLDTSIALGLMINEILTNSLKYAFADAEVYKKGEKEALIYIYAEQNDRMVTITIGDNGAGISELVEIDNSPSLGMELIQSLALQIDAKIELRRENGTEYFVQFQNSIR